ncbi:MAG: serine hydrolase [Patescibacteria group bacterium]|nr:serine hydrolase [Patescibacteria group bacterium]
MFSSILIHLISFFIFSNNIWSQIDWSDFNQGEIIKMEDSQYFSVRMSNIKYPEVSASSFVVLDLVNNYFVLEKNPDEVWPIASISKLMSALVLLDELDIDLDAYYQIRSEDRRVGGRDYLFIGDEVTNRDLLALALIASDNSAISALVSSAGLNEDEFAVLMNKKARQMGMENTSFKDASGLSSKNVSTAREVSLLIKEAFAHEIIADFANKYEYQIITKQGRVKKIVSTNQLLNYNNNYIKIIGGKTGYNDSSGYCLGLKFLFNNNQELISVVLNSATLKSRFSDTQKIFEDLYGIYNN